MTVNCLLAATLALKGHTVCAFGYCGVLLVSAYSDGIQCAVVLGVHVVLAACYIALDRRILSHFRILRNIYIIAQMHRDLFL